ncbi:Aflatoxin biosynthesis regulatory protein [Venturia nashicola]|uniref:Aflatoxin biosynthesis regulatory protein n=1 Tax=Venturia nashicola TaxID=86259 RepID=A0A4Z1P9Z3_9PEZI|nr:Aflatoxin biosynthesis regulatory protein [Venturia nashicola]TLD38115.1 Aflatoxin biosynthesis regulatory protein [Venturia nashicola]
MASTTQNQRKKLRDACDYCALSKVRCNSRKPRCDRCQERGLACLYGLSNRKGRPGAKTSPAQSSSSNGTPYHSQSPETPAWSPDQNDHLFPTYFDILMWDSTIVPSIPSLNGSRDSWPFQHLPDLPLPSSEMANTNGSTLDISQLPQGLSQPYFDPHNPQKPYSTLHDTRGAGRSCITRAFSALFPLHEQKQAYDLIANTALSLEPSDDPIILTARKAKSTLTSLISCKCHPCTQDRSMPFLLIAIAAKIVERYRTLHLHNLQAAYISDGHSTFIDMAALNLPCMTEIRMKALMLLCEIEPLLEICQNFEGRLNGAVVLYGAEEVRDAFEVYWKRELIKLKDSLEYACGGQRR